MKDFELLISRLRQWQRWTSLQKSFSFGIRGLALGLLIVALVAIFLVSSGELLVSEYFVLVAASGLAGLILASAIAWLWPSSRLEAARNYDQTFNLKERVSTAIELSQHQGSDQLWQELQLSDALDATKPIIPKNGLRWRIPKLEIGLVLIAFVLVLGTWFYGQGAFQQAEVSAQNRQLVQAEIENLEELIADIESSDQLSAETKEAMTSPLKESVENMQQAESLEEAVSSLSEAQQTLQELGLSNSAEFEGLQAAGKELAKNQDGPFSAVVQDLSQGNFQDAAENLAMLDLSALNPSELENLSEQLMEMSGQLESSSPELAHQLQQAAEALQNDDLHAAQKAIAAAGEEMSNAAQRAAASEVAQNSADALSDSQGRLMAAAMFGASAQTSEVQNSSSESSDSEQAGSFGNQASSGEFEESKTLGQEAGLTPLTQENTPGESSEKQYDSVYAPQRLGGISDAELSLGSGDDASSNTVGSVTSSSEQNAQSFVPYLEIYSSYEGDVQQALESGIIPLSLQPLIRDYFSSLDSR